MDCSYCQREIRYFPDNYQYKRDAKFYHTECRKKAANERKKLKKQKSQE